MEIEKVSDPARMTTDQTLLSHLATAGLEKDFVAFVQDYTPEHPYAKLYEDRVSKRKFAVISQLPMVKVGGQKIEAAWFYSEKQGAWYSRANLFSAIVSGSKVQLTCLYPQPNGAKLGDQVVFHAQVFVDGVEVLPKSEKPNWLESDPFNENYNQNVLEWDYGICKRRLRLLEGRLLGSWLFEKKPGGTVKLKYNQVGTLRLKLGSFAIGEDEVITPEQFEEFGRYPVNISDSQTFYPDASPTSTSCDGVVRQASVDMSWAAIRATVGNNKIDNDDGGEFCDGVHWRWRPGGLGFRYLSRPILLFDTSGLPDEATVISATLSPFGSVRGNPSSSTISLNIYVPTTASNTELTTTDYNYLGWGATKLCDTDKQYASWSLVGYNAFILNAAGIANISKTGISKFGIRDVDYDVGGSTPPGSGISDLDTYMCCWYSEKGAGYKPKLVVEYSAITVPVMDTADADNIGNEQADLHGEIVSTGGDNCDFRGFVYGKESFGDPGDTAPADSDYSDYWTEGGSFAAGVFDRTQTGLDSGATYYVRACAHNSQGWAYGDQISFATIPDIYTYQATNIESNQATGNGSIESVTGIEAVGFEWGIESGTYDDSVESALIEPGDFALQMTLLEASTKYYFRAYAYDSEAAYIYGEEKFFTTLPPTPVVRTDPPTDAQIDHIDAVGYITSIGSANADFRGFVYGLTSKSKPDYLTAPGASGYDDSVEEEGDYGVGAFAITLSNLEASRTYYVRAWAHNSYGYNYGNELAIVTNYDVNILLPSGNYSAGIRFDTSPGGGYPSLGGGDIPHYLLVRSKDTIYTAGGYWGSISGEGVYERSYYNSNYYTDLYTLTNPYRRTESIIKVKWKARFFANAYPYGNAGREVRTHSTTYSSARTKIHVAALGDTRCEVFYVNLNTSAAWSLAEADALVGGITVGEEASYGIAFGDWFEMRVLWANAEVRTDYGEKLSANELRLNGYVVQDEAEECEVYFEWGLTDGYGNETTPETKRINQFFSADISGLDPLETYHYRAVIETACGETFYGEDAAFIMYRPDRIYVWLGDEDDDQVFELTEPDVELVLSARTERGWDEELAQAAAGICELVCDNFDGSFSPERVDSPLYGLLYLGARITIYEVYKGIQYDHFTGRIDKILPRAEEDNATAYIVALDGMDDLAGTKVTTALRTDTDAGELMGDVLDAAKWPAGARDIDTGIDTLQVGWFHKTPGMNAARDLEMTEKGRFFIKRTGEARFESRHYRITGNGLVSQATFADTMVEMAYEYSKRLLFNEVLVSGRRYFAGGVQLWSGYDLATIDDDLVWSAHTGDDAAPYIPQASTVVIWAEFNSPLSSFTSLVKGTHWNANSQPDKTGTDVSDDITITATQYGQAVKLSIANAGSAGAYLVVPDTPPVGAPDDRTLLIYGVLFGGENLTFLEEDTTSQEAYGKRTLEVDAPFKSRPNDILAFAQWLKARYHEPVPTPVQLRHVARSNWPDDTIRVQCLVREISDRITISSTRLGLDRDFYINKVIQEYGFKEGGTVHNTTWFVEAAEGSAEGLYWLLGVAGFGELGDKTTLGF